MRLGAHLLLADFGDDVPTLAELKAPILQLERVAVAARLSNA